MFEARLLQGYNFRKLIDSIKDLIINCNWDINKSGIHLQAMDSSHVAVVSFSILADSFEHYRVDRNFTLGVDTRMISKILRRLEGDNSLTLRADEGGDSIHFTISSQKNENEEYTFEIKRLNIDSERLNITEKDYKCNITLNAAHFSKICHDLSILDETVTITAGQKGVTFETAGEAGKGKVKLLPSDYTDEGNKKMTIVINDKADGENPLVTQKYALGYLLAFSKASSLTDTVTLQISENCPLLVEYDVPALGFLRFYLAPKVVEEEENEGEEEEETMTQPMEEE